MPKPAPGLQVAADLVLPLETVTEPVAILGIRGSGKTNTATVFAEELLARGQQVVVIDPVDSWWGLKSSADGAAPGYPVVVLGGRRQDLPLAAGDGKAIADFVVEHRASVVCSLRHFESTADQRRFVTEFAQRLYFRKGQEGHETRLMLTIDEASLFVPQRVGADEARMVGAIQKLVRQGRSSGFGVTLIDQRAASVNKDVLTQLELLVCHRTTSPQDRKALGDWVQAHDTAGRGPEFLGALASLPRGTAWFWSPGWLDLFRAVGVRERRTFDSSRTPRPGERAVAPTQVAAVDLEGLKAKLAATVEKARADDPAALKQRVADLERDLRAATAAPAAAFDPGALDAAEQRGRERAMADLRGIVRGRLGALDGALEQLESATKHVTDAARALIHDLVDGYQAATPPATPRPTPSAPATPVPAAPRPRPTPTPTSAPAVAGAARAEPRGDGPQRILDALRWLEVVGIAPASRLQVGVVAHLKLSAGAGSRYVTALVSQSEVTIPAAGQLALTPAGRRRAEAPDVPPTRDALHAAVLAQLDSNGARRVLAHLLDCYPAAETRAAVGAAVGLNLSAGAGSRYATRLVTLGFAEIPHAGQLRASPLLFPERLR